MILTSEENGDVSLCLPQAFLEDEDLGNSLGSVEALLQKHDDFEEAFNAQEEKITVRSAPGGGAASMFVCVIRQLPSSERTTCHCQTSREDYF